jgi:hypothetical protein
VRCVARSAMAHYCAYRSQCCLTILPLAPSSPCVGILWYTRTLHNGKIIMQMIDNHSVVHHSGFVDPWGSLVYHFGRALARGALSFRH